MFGGDFRDGCPEIGLQADQRAGENVFPGSVGFFVTGNRSRLIDLPLLPGGSINFLSHSRVK